MLACNWKSPNIYSLTICIHDMSSMQTTRQNDSNKFCHQQRCLLCNNETASAYSAVSKGSGDTRRLCDTQSEQSHNTHTCLERDEKQLLTAGNLLGLTFSLPKPRTATWRKNKLRGPKRSINLMSRFLTCSKFSMFEKRKTKAIPP